MKVLSYVNHNGRHVAEIEVHEGDEGIVLDVYGFDDVTLGVWVNPGSHQLEIIEINDDIQTRAGDGPVALPVKIAIGVQHGVMAVYWGDGQMISYSTNRSLKEREIAMTGVSQEEWEREEKEAQAARRAIREKWESEQHDAK